jgi:ABC-2 type transport system ATP-binding protein
MAPWLVCSVATEVCEVISILCHECGWRVFAKRELAVRDSFRAGSKNLLDLLTRTKKCWRKMTTVIAFQNLVKRYGKQLAVADLSATIESGKITGFLGPNGAGKSTSLRCLVGLAAPTGGTATIFGKRYQEIENPLSRVGTVLDSRGFHAALTGKQNLRVMAAAAGISNERVDEVLGLVELSDAASKRVKGYSLGMKQRLALAGAILGDPEVLILDEPANGLDPAGIAWLRKFLRSLASSGRTILVSSHQLAEMQNTVDNVLIINKGQLIADGNMKEIIGEGSLEEAFLLLTQGELS